MAAFRESYGKLFELRSLASDIPVIALTATATHLTRDTTVSILHMEQNQLEVCGSLYGKKRLKSFVWLADTLRRERQKCKDYCVLSNN